MSSMIDWIRWTKCPTCDHVEKEVFQEPDDAPPHSATSNVRCLECGSPARYMTFPAFEIETIESSPSADFLRDEMEDW